MENYGKDFLPYELTDYSVKFCVKTAVKFLMEKYGLWERTMNKEIITMAATVDGGDLAWGLTQVSAGVKLVDHKTRDPISGCLLFGESGHKKVQAKHNCFPLYIFITKDNKELYQTHLSQFFREINEFEEEYSDGLRIAQPADMCSLQKTLGAGGAMKCKNYACYCCSIHRDDLAKQQATPCTDCVRLGRTQPCYHQQVTDENLIERLKHEREEHLSTWPHLHSMPAIIKRSRVRCGNVGIVEAEHDPLNVEFQPTNFRDGAKIFFALKQKTTNTNAITHYSFFQRLDEMFKGS